MMFREEIINKINELSVQLKDLDCEVARLESERERYPEVSVEQSVRIISVKEHKGEVTIKGLDIADGEETVYYLSVAEWELALDDGQIEKVRCGSKYGDILRFMISKCQNHSRYFVAR